MNERDSQRLAKIDEKLEQMKARRQDILAKDKKRKRQERTRRLIQIGALTEKYFDMKDIPPTDYENFLKMFLTIPNVDGCIAHAKAQAKGGINLAHEQGFNTESTTNEPSGILN